MNKALKLLPLKTLHYQVDDGFTKKMGREIKGQMTRSGKTKVLLKSGLKEISEIDDDVEYEYVKRKWVKKTKRDQIEELDKQLKKVKGLLLKKNTIKSYVKESNDTYYATLIAYPQMYHEKKWNEYKEKGTGFEEALMMTLYYYVQTAIR